MRSYAWEFPTWFTFLASSLIVLRCYPPGAKADACACKALLVGSTVIHGRMILKQVSLQHPPDPCFILVKVFCTNGMERIGGGPDGDRTASASSRVFGCFEMSLWLFGSQKNAPDKFRTPRFMMVHGHSNITISGNFFVSKHSRRMPANPGHVEPTRREVLTLVFHQLVGPGRVSKVMENLDSGKLSSYHAFQYVWYSAEKRWQEGILRIWGLMW